MRLKNIRKSSGTGDKGSQEPVKKMELEHSRKSVLKYLAAFFLSMLACTMVSRGIYAHRMPRVEIGRASQKSIFHTIRAEGSIEAAKETAVVLPEGMRISEICVEVGEKVEPGKALLYLDEPDLKNLIEDLDGKILVAQAKIEALTKGDPADLGSIMEENHALARMQKQRAIYHRFLKEKGRVESGLDGYAIEICVRPGDRTADRAALLFADCSDASNKWNFKAGLTKEQADRIKAGDMVSLQFQNGRIKEEGCLVSAVRKTGEGTYEAVVAVTESGLSPGEDGTLEMTGQSRKYSCCVPMSAVYSDGNEDYILLVREANTFLGTELSVVRRDVVVLDRNESDAALEGNALGAEEQFVVYANKAVASGDKVRLFEEEDGREI